MSHGEWPVASNSVSDSSLPTTDSSCSHIPILPKKYDKMLKIGSIVWGVKDVPRAIEFWCAALDYTPLREPKEDRAILVPAKGRESKQIAITVESSYAKSHQRHH